MRGGSPAHRREPGNPSPSHCADAGRVWRRACIVCSPGTLPSRLPPLLAASFFSKDQRVREAAGLLPLRDLRTPSGRPGTLGKSSPGSPPFLRDFTQDMGPPTQPQPEPPWKAVGRGASELQLDPSSHLLLRTLSEKGPKTRRLSVPAAGLSPLPVPLPGASADESGSAHSCESQGAPERRRPGNSIVVGKECQK